ncbi:noggin-like [Protopterus annectens]|uniref:noggin-like n=1 Tax=Protopterus annectens TaxID=7888 RepID=UPI001CFA11EA|nr:noggin-like [Protopterus annectens]
MAERHKCSLLLLCACIVLSFTTIHSELINMAEQQAANAGANHPKDKMEAKPMKPESSVVEYSLRMKSSSNTQPYSLSLRQEDYHYFPKPKHLNPVVLLRLLGPSFDPFWMSVEIPNESNMTYEDLTSASTDLANGLLRYQRKLMEETQALDFGTIFQDVVPTNSTKTAIDHLKKWLVNKASCRLTSSWADLGSVFWPRWVRHTECETSSATCSWPPGMSCGVAQITQIKLLAWHCWTAINSANMERTMKQCTWRQVPYPVVTACKCSCR